jgi:hypothetical protein
LIPVHWAGYSAGCSIKINQPPLQFEHPPPFALMIVMELF